MANIVLQATDLGTVTLKPKPGPSTFSLKRAMPDGKWNAPDNPPKPFEGRPVDGATHIDLIQAWAEYKVDLRLNFLDALVKAVEGVFASIGTLMAGDIGGGIRSAAQQLRDLIGDDYRELFINWECKFENDADTTLLVEHLNDYNVSVTRTTAFTPAAPAAPGAPAASAPAAAAAPAPAASRMAWLIDTRLRIGSTMLDGARVSVAGKATSSDTTSKADMVFVRKGEHTVESISHIRLDCEGFARDVSKLFDDMMTAITEGIEIEKLVAEHMVQYIKDRTYTVLGAVLSSPDAADTQKEQERYRKEQMDLIKSKIRSLVNLLQTQLLNLLQEYKGFIALDKSLVGLTSLSDTGIKRVGAVLLEEAKKEKDKHVDNRQRTREHLLRSDRQPKLAGRSLFGPEEWAAMGLDGAAYAFSVVSTETLETHLAIADVPAIVPSDNVRIEGLTFTTASVPVEPGETSDVRAPRTNIRSATPEELRESARVAEFRREERRRAFTTGIENPPAETLGDSNPGGPPG